MGLFDDSGLDVLNPSDFSGSFSGAPLMDSSWTAMSSPSLNVGGSASDSGGWFGDLKDVAGRVWGSAPTKDMQGSGVSGFLSDLGSVAKTVMPLAQIGGGIASFLAQRDAMKQLDRTGRTTQQATGQQIASAQTAQRSAEQAQEIAPKVVDLAPRIEAVADSVRPVMERAQATGDEMRRVASDVDPLAQRAATLSSDLQRTGADTRSMTVDPVVTFAADRLARAQRGEIPPQIQAQIDRWKSGALQQARDYLARAGMGDSTAMLQMERTIDEQANAAAANFLMNEEKQALMAFDQARQGFATTGDLYSRAGAPLKDAAGMYDTEASILGKSLASDELALRGLDLEALIRGRAGAAYGTAGNILAGAGAAASGAGQTAGGAARTTQNEQIQIEQLLAAINNALGRLGGRAA